MLMVEDAQIGDVEHPGAVHALAAYFQAVAGGTHLLGREWAYVVATPHNRRCFVHLLTTIFSPRALASAHTPGTENLWNLWNQNNALL